MNYPNSDKKIERNKWLKLSDPETTRPPFEEYVLVVTLDGLPFFAFRKSNKFFCCTPTPSGVIQAEIEECFIDQYMIPQFPIDAESLIEEKPQISVVSESE